MRFPCVASFLACLTAISGACSSGGGGGGDPTITLSGEVLFVPEMLVTEERPGSIDSTREPLSLAPERAVRVQGRLEGGRDALRLHSARRVAVVARLEGDGEARLAALDPVSLAVGEAGREARFLARGPLDLLVHGSEAGAYELRIAARPIAGPVELSGHLGTFLVGDELALLARDGDRARLSCAESLDLVIAAEGALTVLDLDGREVARLDAAGGEARVEAGPLASFELVAAGSHAAPLVVRARPAAVARPCARVHPLAAERAAFGLGPEAPLATAVTHEFVAGEVLVRAREGQELEGDIARRSGRVTQRIPETSDLVAVELPPGLDSQEAARTTLALIAAFAASERVEWAEPNRIRRAQGGVDPDDDFYPLQWHYELIRLPQAWAQTVGSANVIVAVIDTGFQPHPDLDANLDLADDFDFISSAANAADGDGIDADATDVGDTDGLRPSSFHGTHVAGTVGAVGNNAQGVAGVNWVSRIRHLRVLGKQGGTDADIANAIRFAAGLSSTAPAPPTQRAHVINMSLGGPGASSTTQNAVTAARNAGVVIFAAAGNENSSQPSFPASFAGVISVSAVDLNAQRAPYSNFGPSVDLAAPGGDTSVDRNGDGFADGVLSTLVDESMPGFPPIFVFYQGTSMACPHAAGVAALMLAVEPTLTPAQIEAFLTSTALDLGNAGRDDVFGHGLIQADLAVAAAAGSTSATPVLVATPAALEFGTEATELTINVVNGGGGTLDVGVPMFTPDAGDPAFASLTTVAGGGTSDVSAVRVAVDRTGLADGSYGGVVTIPSDGGTATVDVRMQVVNVPAPLDVPLFLLLIDAVTFETRAQVDLNPVTTLAWTIQSTVIPAGDYFLVCGSDDDLDGFIFGDGDVYTGAWPTLNEVELLFLAGGSVLADLDFVVAPLQQTPRLPGSGGFPPEGFRLLRTGGAGPDT